MLPMQMVAGNFNSLNLFFGVLSATHMAYGSFQAKGSVGAAAAGLYHSHSSTGSEPLLHCILQLMATTPDL